MELFKILIISIISIFIFQSQIYGINLSCDFNKRINTKYFNEITCSEDLDELHQGKIFEVCNRTPATSHWLPTREAKLFTLMQPEVVPKNLIIRMSSHMIDQAPVKFWPHTSTVVRAGKTCPAKEQGNQCASCRSCWNKEVSNVAYPLH